MNISISKAIVHIADPSSPLPILSNQEITLNSDVSAYLINHIEKVLLDDNCKQCTLTTDSPVLNESISFLEYSQNIAAQIFTIMHRNSDIPAADLVFGLAKIDATDLVFMLKMDYRCAYVHHVSSNGHDELNNYKTLLPNNVTKLSESFFINYASGTVRVLEKRFNIDGIKDFYLSQYILLCSQEKSPKQKITKVLQIAKKINELYYTPSDGMDTHIADVVCNEVAQNDVLLIENLGAQFFGDNIVAKEEFYHRLENEQIILSDTISISDKSIKRLEKQSIKSSSGIEVKIPIEIYRSSENLIEFINNPDGTVSLLIKNIVI